MDLKPAMKDNIMAQTSDYYGSIVAFEGSRDTVSTQLRLLPRSSNILILPPLRHFVQEKDADAPFDARTYILSIHEACSARIKMAHSFLQYSSPAEKRLVFMNGGTASALTTCITSIGQHTNKSSVPIAQNAFTKLVRNGVAGLRKHSIASLHHRFHQSPASSKSGAVREGADHASCMSEAMRAADALDRETASLQPDNDIDLTGSGRPRSMSVPLRRLVDDLEDNTPFYLFGASHDGDEAISIPAVPQKIEDDVDKLGPGEAAKARSTKFEVLRNSSFKFSTDSSLPNCTGEPYTAPSPRSVPAFGDVLNSGTAIFGSLSSTPLAFYGEARLVDVHTSPEQRVGHRQKRTRSVDRVYAGAIRNQDISVRNFSQPLNSRSPHDSSSISETIQTTPSELERLPLRSKFNDGSAGPTFFIPKKSSTRRPPPDPLELSNSKSAGRRRMHADRGQNLDEEGTGEGGPAGVCYTDRGVDAADVNSLKSAAPHQRDPDLPFETVLPMHEDLIIHFNDEKHSTLLESVIQDYRRGVYPIPLPPLTEDLEDNSENPRASVPDHQTQGWPRIGGEAAISTPSYSEDEEYAAVDSHISLSRAQAQWSEKHHGRNRPPTPARTPPPEVANSDKSFHEFKTTDCATAVCVQNSLRSILNLYFSPDEHGYQQYPLLPELSSMWKPVFREEIWGAEKEKRKLDLILAIGAQNGVGKDFLLTLTGSLVKLGMGPNGTTRSGRLDIRYLIANAMQSYTSQPLAKQTRDNPFTNSLLLATLIIPHLETYLAAHSETRFLILEYPPEHLSTVLALQRLVGVDVLKVAGVLAAESPEPKPSPSFPVPTSRSLHSNNLSTSSTASTRTNATLVSPKQGSKCADAPPFSKANFLLTSAATECEIATLISTIWRILIDISHFYIPEGVPKYNTTRKEFPEPSNETSSGAFLLATSASEYGPFTSARAMMGFLNPSALPEIKEPVTEHTELRQQLTTSPASITSSKTPKATNSARRKLQRLLTQETGGEIDKLPVQPPAPRTSYCEVSEDEESTFYHDERRYMPLYAKEPESRKGNSRKALKFLGLA